MKRYMALLACLFALTACGNQSDADNASADAEASNGNDSAASAESGDQTNGQASDQAGDFDSDKARRSYALGMDIGNSLKELPVDIQVDELSQGVSDVVSGKETRLSQDELDSVMQSFVKEMEAAQQQKASQQAQNNLEKGEKFLAENKDKEGVKTTDSGLQYKVLEEGDGPSPSADDSVTVHYTGKLIDGTVFDSSRERGEPVTFPVDAVIPGWTEALQLMKQGAKYELYIPAKLAYGERGAGAQIGPNETLIFDVELLKVGSGDSDESAAGGQGNSQPDADADTNS
ncbi:FKBP-type peptidyl-prolyl cis-trans isomerase [Salinisphaera sp.]|uniref:FKBP-type peptidyl-prolyl cis-trans isomerase n=1 Tax=Salinisphaera sp. TaxID=1914330 RepID=UPI0025D07E8A|nr:FKBP-type peptidyl-prolyl cis-trans isomerase [Salinisphaera sp.]